MKLKRELFSEKILLRVDRKKIQVWAKTPEVGTSSDLAITDITQAKVVNRKYVKDGEEKWATDYVLEAVVEKINVSPIEGFSQITDESIPF